MALAFLPLYIDYLGLEAYGLIGVFALLQAWLTLLDIGMKPTLVREMARFTAGEHDAQSVRDLLRSIEFIAISVALLVGFGIWGASGWLAADWLGAKTLPLATVAQAIALMGGVAALRLLENIYISGISGLQRQVLQNVLSSVMATLRGLGAVAALAWVAPRIEVFFLWQGIVSLLTVLVFATAVYRTLPAARRRARISRSALLGVWRFAAGMTVITVLSLLLTQVDKILLSRLLSLKAFGAYALAAAVTGGLYLLSGPVTAAYYPRFTELVARGDDAGLARLYHQSAQLVSVLMGSAAVILSVFASPILLVWTNEPSLAVEVAPLLTLLAAGTLANGLMWIPYHLQLAHAWTSLTIKTNIVAVCLLIPAILYLVPRHGAMGAAGAWLALNSGYLTVGIGLMHRRLLPREKWRWYLQDVALPLAAAGSVAGLLRLLLPQSAHRLGELALLALAAGLSLLAAALAASTVRPQLLRLVRRR